MGSVPVSSAKNAVLPLFAASVLTEEPVTIRGVPAISDAMCMAQILRELGAEVTFSGGDVTIDSASSCSHEIPPSLTRELRSSVFMLGSLLTRFRRALIAYPGGCDIGLRPIDMHLSALRRLGVSIDEEDGYIFCECDNLKGAEISLDFPSVGATENVLLAAVMAEGETVLRGAAREPEIVDLARFLQAMGAKICGAGTDVIAVEGVKKLRGVSYAPMKDRIEAGTYLIMAAVCGGEVETQGVAPENLGLLLHKLRENGCKIGAKNDKIRLESLGKLKCNRRIETMPFPGFPTDLQAQAAALNSGAEGCALIEENLFETRFKYVPELRKMGADIEVKGRTALIRGVPRLHGASLVAGDLRGAAALVVAALGAEGESEVLDLSISTAAMKTCRTNSESSGRRSRACASEPYGKEIRMKKKVLILTGVAVALLIAVIAAALNAVFTVARVEVHFSVCSSQGEAEAVLLQGELTDAYVGRSTTFLKLEEVEGVVERYPAFRVVSAEKHFPRTVYSEIARHRGKSAKNAMPSAARTGFTPILDERACTFSTASRT